MRLRNFELLRRQVNGHAAGKALYGLLCAALLGACASNDTERSTDWDETDLWESSVVMIRHIDVGLLTDAGNRLLPDLTGFLSSVAARGNDLYFVDEGAGKLVHVGMASMTATTIASLRNGRSAGIYADFDGTVYAVDAFNRQILHIDPYHGEIGRVELGAEFGNPVDVAVLEDERVLLVLDALDGRIVALDQLGGLQRIYEPRALKPASLLSAKMIDASNGEFFVLDNGSDEVIGFDPAGRPVGSYGADDLQHVTAMATDSCGRLFVTDEDDGSLYIGFADMSLPGRRIRLSALSGTEASDLWTDDSFLYVATRSDGIFVFLLDPECGP